MKHIVIDLEMNTLAKAYKKEKHLCGREIIEIGAVLLDEQYQEIGSFKTFVKPQYNNVITTYITKLTGITTEMVENAPIFEDAIRMFAAWCNSIKDDVKLYQWSNADQDQIIRELHFKNIELKDDELNILTKWEDFQKEYGEKLQLSNAISLKNAIMYAGVDFAGQEHDALNDARNTATLLKIVRDPALCKKALENVIEALTPTSVSTALGDLFNFAELGIVA